MSEGRPNKEEQYKANNFHRYVNSQMIPKNIALDKSLNIDLYGILSISEMFPTWVLGNLKKKTLSFLWNTSFSRLVARKWSFFWHSSCLKTLEGSKVICVFFLILSKYLSMLLRHALDQKYKIWTKLNNLLINLPI